MENDVKILHFAGWHGTSEESAAQILESNFQESAGPDHWLGDGVYFFTNGLGDPFTHARDWIISEAHKTKISRYAILRAGVHVNDTAILDLRTVEGLELFNQFRRSFLAKVRRGKKGFANPDESYSDSKVIEVMKQKVEIEVVIKNMYVRFGQDRIEKISSRIENCTFFCVSNPDDNINPDDIEIVQRGNI